MIGNMYEIIQQRNNYKRECSVYKLGLNNHANEPYKEITHEMFNKLIQQRDQYKAENKKLKAERDTLIDDLPWYKAKVSRLEDENEQLKESHIKHITNMENYYKDRVQELKEKNGELQEVIEGKNRDLLFTEDENAQLKQDLLRTEELQDEIIQLEKDFENKHNLLSEISQHIGNKPSSSTYKYFRAKLDCLGIKEDE